MVSKRQILVLLLVLILVLILLFSYNYSKYNNYGYGYCYYNYMYTFFFSFSAPHLQQLVNSAKLQQHNCLPKENVAFLKLAKCSSSTVANILLRHVLTNNLNLVIDEGRHSTMVGDRGGM
jgi:hypothetical protein